MYIVLFPFCSHFPVRNSCYKDKDNFPTKKVFFPYSATNSAQNVDRTDIAWDYTKLTGFSVRDWTFVRNFAESLKRILRQISITMRAKL